MNVTNTSFASPNVTAQFSSLKHSIDPFETSIPVLVTEAIALAEGNFAWIAMCKVFTLYSIGILSFLDTAHVSFYLINILFYVLPQCNGIIGFKPNLYHVMKFRQSFRYISYVYTVYMFFLILYRNLMFKRNPNIIFD